MVEVREVSQGEIEQGSLKLRVDFGSHSSGSGNTLRVKVKLYLDQD